MQTLDLNLSTRPYRNNTLLWLGYGVAVLLLVGASTLAVRAYVCYDTKLGEVSQGISSFEDRSRALERRDEAARNAIRSYRRDVLEGQVQKANDVIERKAFSWTRLFNELEVVQPKSVRMLTIRPEFGTARARRGVRVRTAEDSLGFPVLIEALGKDFKSVLDLQNALFASPHFGRVEMDRIQRNQSQRDEFLFVARFMYYPDGRADAVASPGDAVIAADVAVPDEIDVSDDEFGEASPDAAPEPVAADDGAPDGDEGLTRDRSVPRIRRTPAANRTAGEEERP